MAWKHTESAHKRGYGAHWRKVRALVLARDRGLCVPCDEQGRTTAAVAVDHILNRAQGGTDDLDNLQSICDECHLEKTLWEARGRPSNALRVDADGWPIPAAPAPAPGAHADTGGGSISGAFSQDRRGEGFRAQCQNEKVF